MRLSAKTEYAALAVVELARRIDSPTPVRIREICAATKYPKDEQFVQFLSCMSTNYKAADWKACATSANMKPDANGYVLVNGRIAWDVNETTNARSWEYLAGIDTAEFRQLEIILTPHGFVKAALAPGANPAIVPGGTGDTRVQLNNVLGKYKVNAYISQNVVHMVETWIPNPIVGDMRKITHGVSPDYRVSREWLLASPTTTVPDTALEPARPIVIYREDVPDGAEVDARFAVHADAPVYVYVVATAIDDVNEAVRRSREDAPGDYRISGTPPPPLDRKSTRLNSSHRT